MKKRGLVISLLVMLAVITSGFTYAFWAGSITVEGPGAAVGSINIGEGGQATTTVVVNNVEEFGVNLVPVGYEADNSLEEPVMLSDVSSISLVFSVNWSGVGAEDATGTLAVTVTGLSTTIGLTEYPWLAGGEGFENLYGEMFTVTIADASSSITAGTLKTVTVTVQFTNEPASQTIYSQVANGLLEIDLSFAVTPTT